MPRLLSRRDPPTAVRLQEVDDRSRADVLALTPAPGQSRFSGIAAQTLPAAERHRTREPVAILRGHEAVGFLALDRADPICAYVEPRPAVALRAFFVDERYQREGIATAALDALPRFLVHRHPVVEVVVLTVNVSNPVATALYLRAGYVDTGRVHLAGATGPQHVLVLELP